MLFQNADPNQQAYDGNTPLHLAVSNGHRDIVRFLMKVHADPEIENCQIDEDTERGQTALDLAEDDEVCSSATGNKLHKHVYGFSY